jgi:hypothetical protein
MRQRLKIALARNTHSSQNGEISGVRYAPPVMTSTLSLTELIQELWLGIAHQRASYLPFGYLPGIGGDTFVLHERPLIGT